MMPTTSRPRATGMQVSSCTSERACYSIDSADEEAGAMLPACGLVGWRGWLKVKRDGLAAVGAAVRSNLKPGLRVGLRLAQCRIAYR